MPCLRLGIIPALERLRPEGASLKQAWICKLKLSQNIAKVGRQTTKTNNKRTRTNYLLVLRSSDNVARASFT